MARGSDRSQKTCRNAGRPLLNSAYAVAAVAVPVAGCSAPTTSAPAPSQSTPPTTSRAKTSTRGTVNQSGRLPIPEHHAAGALVEGRDLVLGGGSTTVTSVVQDVTPGASSLVVSYLPQHLPYAPGPRRSIHVGGLALRHRRAHRWHGDRRSHALRPCKRRFHGRWTPARRSVRLWCRGG